MDQLIKILIVEDNVIIADDMQSMLEEIGYNIVANVVDYESAVEALENNDVDLALLDIMLATEKTGIDIGKYIRENKNIPFIFVTSNSDKATVENAKSVKPNGYLVKPFEQQDLFTSIEIALCNFNDQAAAAPAAEKEKGGESNTILRNSIFVKKNQHYHRIAFDDIHYVKADNVYLEVHTKDKSYLVRSAMKDYIEKLPSHQFFRAHKSYIVNLEHIQAINTRDIVINGETIPISKDFRDFVLSNMNS
ncbi:LytR/AlgR family response regulator transcription factor [Robertkochia sediminum]|uniref:LytR/AlgR family response regulator transcription factor n=1 Tax=Robertkochia sediminum TaxID=2785326 RepID=UPI001932F87F|nr:response regulator [Robertkochia sediminum]MBL7473394.1 response regulator [Robertkochia sediminum]